jgi:hypothetical protein
MVMPLNSTAAPSRRRDVTPAEDGVTAGKCQQLADRSASRLAGSPTSRIQFSFTQSITARARSVSLNW